MRLARYCPVAPSCLVALALCLSAAACGNTQSTDLADLAATPTPANGFAPIATDGVSDDSLVAPPAPVLNVRATAAQLVFSWSTPPEQSTSELIRFNLVTREYSPLFSTSGNLVTEYTYPLAAHRTDWQNTRFLLETCHAEQCLVSRGKRIEKFASELHSAVPREKVAADQRHGQTLALSADGKTLVIGGNGYALVQFQVANQWWDSATLVGDTQTTVGRFANSVAIDGDGDTVAVGAPGEQNQAGVIDGGVVYIYERLGEGWANTARLDSTEHAQRHFGTQVVLSNDSNLLLVATPRTAVNEVTEAGKVWVYQRISSQWRLIQELQAEEPSTNALFGNALSLANDHNQLFVSELADKGQVHEYHLRNGQFIPIRTVTNSSPDFTQFAENMVSDDAGNTLAITRRRTDAAGASGNPSPEVLVYQRTDDGEWQLDQTMAPSDVESFDSSLTMALSSDASTLSIGVVNPGSANNSVTTYTSDRPWITGGFTWARNRPLYSPGSGHDEFARALALSENGRTLLVAAPGTEKDRLVGSGELYAW